MVWSMHQPRARSVWELARWQHGAVARQQLLALGLSRRAIEHRLATGRLHPVAPGVYAVGRSHLGALGRWWAEMIELPSIVMAGSEIASVEAVAATGAEFVALSSAVFADGADAAERVAAVNALLDKTAPRFEAGE